VFSRPFSTHTHLHPPPTQIQGLLARWGQVLGDGPKTYEEAEQQYSQALEPLAVGVFDADAPGAYNSHFKTMANQQEGESLNTVLPAAAFHKPTCCSTAEVLHAAALCMFT
jgi:hypothetical protein